MRLFVPSLLFLCVLFRVQPVSAQITVHTQGFNTSLSPWAEQNVTGNLDWGVTNQGQNPLTNPQEGAQFAYCTTGNRPAGEKRRIYSPNLDLTGANVAECRFYMRRDINYPSDDDYIKFEVSINGGGSYSTLAVFHRYGPATVWEEKVVPLGYYTNSSTVRLSILAVSGNGNNIYIDNLTVTKDTLAAGAEGADCTDDVDCDSGICGVDPFGNGRCRSASTDCIDGNRLPVQAGTVQCYGNELYTCVGPDDWQTEPSFCQNNDAVSCQAGELVESDCARSCGAYDDVDQCVDGTCVECATSCTGDADCKPGISCVANECQTDLPLGDPCTSGTQCQSTYCVDGRCCNNSCSGGVCRRCDLTGQEGTCSYVPSGEDPDGECGTGVCAAKCNGFGSCGSYPGTSVKCDVCTHCNGSGLCSRYSSTGTDPDADCPLCKACSGSSNTCVFVQAGQDPLNECTSSAQSTCGQDGSCDGAAACRKWPAGTECLAASCSNGTMIKADTCDGNGVCTDGGTQDCGVYQCAGSICAASCNTHALCAPSAFCATGGVCLPDLPDGDPCGNVLTGLADDAACLGGHCLNDNWDGSGAWCSGDDRVCLHDASPYQPGDILCSGNDWYRTCIGGDTGWSAQVGCQGYPCDAGGGPNTGYHQPSACVQGDGCTATCTSCYPYLSNAQGCLSGCTVDGNCWAGLICKTGTCQTPQEVGQPCSNASECATGYCVDHVCCLTSCTGTCRACNLQGRLGYCSNLDSGQDPDNECTTSLPSTCGTTGACNGSGACAQHPAGTECRAAQCQADGVTLDPRQECDGFGHCVPKASVPCSPYRCTNGACANACISHQGCAANAFCGRLGNCQPDLVDGASCDNVVFVGSDEDQACAGGFCFTDSFNGSGAYCASSATSCVAAGTSYQPGFELCGVDQALIPFFRSCIGGDAGWGPRTDCPRPCFPCEAGGGPTSGHYGVTTCESGPDGNCLVECFKDCMPYLVLNGCQCAVTCTPGANPPGCWPGFRCDANGSCTQLNDLGKPCENGADCEAGLYCVDGYCCNDPCEGTCMRCNDDTVQLGVCFAVPDNEDPDQECPEENTCDGGAATCCRDGVVTHTSVCNGNYSCRPESLEHCPSGLCEDDHCLGQGTGLPPVAEAGIFQIVAAGQKVTLDGRKSFDPDGGTILRYQWTQTSGPVSVTLVGETSVNPQFVPGSAGTYGFQLVVNDTQFDSDPDFTEVRVIAAAEDCGCAEVGTGSPLALLLLVFLQVRRRRVP